MSNQSDDPAFPDPAPDLSTEGDALTDLVLACISQGRVDKAVIVLSCVVEALTMARHDDYGVDSDLARVASGLWKHYCNE